MSFTYANAASDELGNQQR